MPASHLRGRAALVTGGAGFIGSHLVDALLEAGAAVRVLDDLSTGRRENLGHAEIELLVADLRDADACAAACRDVDIVFHQAALGSVPRSLADPASTIDVNVGGSARLLAAARQAGVERLVYASSSSVYGDSEELPRREGREGRALSPYAASKRMAEELAEVFTAAYGMRIVGLRYFNVYGPRQSPEGPYAAVIPRFFQAAVAGEAPVIYGDGAQSRDFTYVADAVRANLLAASAPPEASGAAFNVASGVATTVAALADRITRMVGSGVPARHEAPRPGDVRHSVADLELARRTLGYAPRVGLDEGLELARLDYEKISRPEPT